MPDAVAERSSWRVLDPIDRISEALFGLIMVLTFTGSLSAAEAGQSEIKTMLIGSLGCNLAWGLIDAIFYLMARLSERSKGIGTLRAVHAAADAETARRAIAGALTPLLASLMTPAALDAVSQRIKAMPDPAEHPHLDRTDWMAAFASFMWVFMVTFPVVLPFVFMKGDADAGAAHLERDRDRLALPVRILLRARSANESMGDGVGDGVGRSRAGRDNNCAGRVIGRQQTGQPQSPAVDFSRLKSTATDCG